MLLEGCHKYNSKVATIIFEGCYNSIVFLQCYFSLRRIAFDEIAHFRILIFDVCFSYLALGGAFNTPNYLSKLTGTGGTCNGPSLRKALETRKPSRIRGGTGTGL